MSPVERHDQLIQDLIDEVTTVAGYPNPVPSDYKEIERIKLELRRLHGFRVSE